MSNNQQQDTLIKILILFGGVLAFVWIISQAVQNVRTFFDQNIWARWILTYIFSIGVGILLSFVMRRLANRYYRGIYSPLITKGWLGSILGLVFCFILSGNQMDYLANYYSWNTLIGILMPLSAVIVIFGIFIIFIKYVFK